MELNWDKISFKHQWSNSRKDKFDQCAHRFLHDIAKTPCERDNRHLERGLEIHKKGENFLLGIIQGVPPEYKRFQKEMKLLKKNHAQPEVDVAVTKDWKPSFGTDWNNVWIRAKIDAIDHYTEEAHIIDYKTGKVYKDKAEQAAELYTACAAAHNLDVPHFFVEFWYLDSGEKLGFEYTRDDAVRLQKKYSQVFDNLSVTVDSMLEDQFFPKNPSRLCEWCEYKKAGICDAKK